MKKFLENNDNRRYIYRITVAALALAATIFTIDAVVQEQLISLVAAILNVQGAVTAELASRNVEK